MAQTNTQKTSWRSTIKEIVILLLIVFLIRTFGFGLYVVPTGSMEVTMLVGERFFADKFTVLFSKPGRGAIISLNDPTYHYSDNRLKHLFEQYVWGPMNVTKRVIGIPGDHVRGTVEDGKPVVYVNDKKLDEPYLNKYPLLIHVNADGTEIKMSSFDPASPYDQQPFYDVPSDLVPRVTSVHPELTDHLGPVTIAADGAMLLEPGQPISVMQESALQLDQPENKMTGVVRKNGSYWTDTDYFDVRLGENQYWLMGDNRRGSKDSRSFGPVGGDLIHGKIVFRIWSIDSHASWWIVDLITHPINFWSRVRWNRCMMRVK